MNKDTATLLEEYFDTAFNAADGIKKLRELILTLAMQGKLVPQDPSDPPASALLKEIEAEKKRLVQEGKIKTSKPLPPVTEAERPYALPPGWEWVRIKAICFDFGQKTPDKRFTYIDVGSIDSKAGVVGQDVQVLEAEEAPSRARKIVQRGTVIYSTVRPYLLNIAIIEDEYHNEAIASTAFAILHPFAGVINQFVYYYLRSSVFIKYVEARMKGVAYPAINDGDFFQGVFPLPPEPEQHRIVAKIDELMARCDALEKLRTAQNEKRLSVHAAAIQQLLNIAEPAQHQRAQAFLADHFGDLYTVKENVSELRKAILQLAVMGKLVPQNPNDPPASALLKEIEAEKKRLVQAGKIKAPKPLPPVTEEEKPYGLPQGWEWVRLGVLAIVNGGFAFKSSKYSDNGVRVIRISDFDENGFKDDRVVRHPYSDDLINFSLEPNNILMAMTGGTVGKSFLAKKIPELMVVNQRVATIKIFEKVVPEYINALIRTDLIQSVIHAAKNSTNDNISMVDITGFLVPLPSSAEQDRIVAKIDELMALCDTLDQQIDAATAKQAELLAALMALV